MKRTVGKEVDLLFYIKSFEIYKQRIGIFYNLTMLELLVKMSKIYSIIST